MQKKSIFFAKNFCNSKNYSNFAANFNQLNVFIMENVSKITWFEERNLKCSISLKPSSMGEVMFTYIDDAGSEFEITAPEYSFNVNPAAGVGNIGHAGGYVSRVGRTDVIHLNGRVVRIGNTQILYAQDMVSSIGSVAVTFLSKRIARIGNTRINFSSNQVYRVGNASIIYSGNTVARISDNVK